LKVITARKVTKNKGVFTSDMVLVKLIYLATERITRKWTLPLQNWSIAASQLKFIFGDRTKTESSFYRPGAALAMLSDSFQKAKFKQ
jgi:hypothetical protein